ncbi:nucleotidyltransferase family protein [Shewanella salipaludis]|uniref:Nucleotidyltransferase family protein n=1 Tax=Shewanella salipaludis TaxID=2723052 RepID=A0A972FSQ0_9GAMM|nr:nucleotidyltransferase family protein [Shewanella salipaludis]NMH64534.1 nucleotidyltransferase family protein [Shewanella salipaludis]
MHRQEGHAFEPEARLLHWLGRDEARLLALMATRQLASEEGLADWLLTAGFVRDLVWDNLHGYPASSLNDIDFIYFCAKDTSRERDARLEARLRLLAPEYPWSVKNQARMHLRNADRPYRSTEDAMGFWPEQETAVGVALREDMATPLNETGTAALDPAQVRLVSVFGWHGVFSLQLTANGRRDRAVFEQRLQAKGWLARYPQLRLASA